MINEYGTFQSANYVKDTNKSLTQKPCCLDFLVSQFIVRISKVARVKNRYSNWFPLCGYILCGV